MVRIRSSASCELCPRLSPLWASVSHWVSVYMTLKSLPTPSPSWGDWQAHLQCGLEKGMTWLEFPS